MKFTRPTWDRRKKYAQETWDAYKTVVEKHDGMKPLESDTRGVESKFDIDRRIILNWILNRVRSCGLWLSGDKCDELLHLAREIFGNRIWNLWTFYFLLAKQDRIQCSANDFAARYMRQSCPRGKRHIGVNIWLQALERAATNAATLVNSGCTVWVITILQKEKILHININCRDPTGYTSEIFSGRTSIFFLWVVTL